MCNISKKGGSKCSLAPPKFFRGEGGRRLIIQNCYKLRFWGVGKLKFQKKNYFYEKNI